MPNKTFNFCCTIDGSERKEADLSQMKGTVLQWKPEMAKRNWDDINQEKQPQDSLKKRKIAP